jgi:uncharacterized protein
MMASDAVIIVFCKAPVTGQVKTRLIPSLGADGATALASELIQRTIRTCHAADLAPVQVWADRPHPIFEPWQPIHLQSGNDLGERMYNALHAALSVANVSRVILLGSDCPSIDESYLHKALQALHTGDAVLGPAEDGGYGLIGFRTVDRAYFEGIEWSTSLVCAETCRRLNAARLQWSLLPQIWDVDRAEDVRRYRQMR